MTADDGRFTLVYNGEVYNYLELREELIALGRTFHSQSDTEVVVQAFAQWGSDAFDHFNGMFALAIWDRNEQTLVLARDHFGIKPLYALRGRPGRRVGQCLAVLERDPAAAGHRPHRGAARTTRPSTATCASGSTTTAGPPSSRASSISCRAR